MGEPALSHPKVSGSKALPASPHHPRMPIFVTTVNELRKSGCPIEVDRVSDQKVLPSPPYPFCRSSRVLGSGAAVFTSARRRYICCFEGLCFGTIVYGTEEQLALKY